MADWLGNGELHVKGNLFWGLIWTDDISLPDGAIQDITIGKPEDGPTYTCRKAEIKNIPGGIMFRGTGEVVINDKIEA